MTAWPSSPAGGGPGRHTTASSRSTPSRESTTSAPTSRKRSAMSAASPTIATTRPSNRNGSATSGETTVLPRGHQPGGRRGGYRRGRDGQPAGQRVDGGGLVRVGGHRPR